MTKSIKLSSLIATGKLWEKGEHSRIYLNEADVTPRSSAPPGSSSRCSRATTSNSLTT